VRLVWSTAGVDIGVCGVHDRLGQGTGQPVRQGSVLFIEQFCCEACLEGLRGIDRSMRQESNLSIGSGGSTCTACGCCGVVEPDLLAALDGYAHTLGKNSRNRKISTSHSGSGLVQELGGLVDSGSFGEVCCGLSRIENRGLLQQTIRADAIDRCGKPGGDA